MQSNETLEIIKRRRSVREYKSEQITPDELRAVLEAGLYAPFAEENGRHFAVIQDPVMLERLESAAKSVAALSGIEHLAALGRDGGFRCMYGAPTLVLLSGSERGTASEADCAAAAENMMIAAESLGLGSCYLFFVTMAFWGPQGEALRHDLRMLEGYKSACGVILGYRTCDAAGMPEKRWDMVTFV